MDLNLPEPMPSNRTPSAYRVHRVVLTGGPCGGKTTAQQHLHKYFTNIGWKVFVVPETPTIFINGGVRFAELTPEQNYIFQVNLLRAQINTEAVFVNLAESLQRHCLVICDRGVNDIRAYIDDHSWAKMLKGYGVNGLQLRDERYDQVIHLTTAADGAHSFYTRSTNTARSESAQQAVQLDLKTRNAWTGHSCLDIVDNANTSSFEDKMGKVLRVVLDRMCLEPTTSCPCALPLAYRKQYWLVQLIDKSKLPQPVEEFELIYENMITESDNIQSQLRTRKQADDVIYESRVTETNGTSRKVTQRAISIQEYNCLRKLCDPNKPPITKNRCSFFWHGLYFHLDLSDSQSLLQTYTNLDVKDIRLPIDLLTVIQQ